MIGDFFEIKKASCDAWLFISKLEFLSNWWLQRESNQRHRDFQSLALPTELWSHLAVSTGLEPAIFCVTGRRVNQLHHETTWLRGEDLNLWPLGYEPNELPGCSIPRYQILNWRRKRDSNPCAGFPTSRFSRPVPSTRLGYSSTLVPKAGLEPARGLILAGF